MPQYTLSTNGKLEPYLHREWLLTNHLGAFASSTVVGCNTRRYHALLCAALQPPVARHVLLSRIGEVIHLDDKEEPAYEISINQFEHDLHPRGDKHLRQFELGDTAKWTFDVDGVTVEKELLLCWRRNTIGIRYTIKSAGRKVKLELMPFVAMRDFHMLRHGTDVPFGVQSWSNHATVMDERLHLHMVCDKGLWKEQPFWWYGHVYAIDAERGMDHTEELWNPGRFIFEAASDDSVTFWASAEPADLPSWEQQLAARREATAQVNSTLPKNVSPAMMKLWRAADDFIVDKHLPGGRVGKSIVAGYPWFADWGRDTMISLPGLLLATGRYETAYEVLASFAEHISQGMIPNRFDDYTGEPHYNTVDASLWFIHAAQEYLHRTRDTTRYQGMLLPACQKIVQGYREGTRFGIHMDPADSLITQGDASTQLTWMDAKSDGVAFTPRQGKPVEINALWYNALMLLGEKDLAKKVKKSFVATFWISPFRGLADVIHDGHRDSAIRPNQIFAVSLANSPLSIEQQQAVVEVVRRELLTPYGLRTLSRDDPKYCPRYVGTMQQRDAAYHNGTVWPWLMGPFIEAYLRTNDHSPEAKAQCRQWLAPLVRHLDEHCLGQIAEIFDADPPHRPMGCFAQAWSVAEILRVGLLAGM